MTATLAPGTLIATPDHKRFATVLSPDQAIAAGLICEGGTVAVNSGTADHPYYSFVLLTGRTRRKWGTACPTLVRFECDTVTRGGKFSTFAIWGVPGARIPGIWLTRPENLD